jgi:hypothetical protein
MNKCTELAKQLHTVSLQTDNRSRSFIYRNHKTDHKAKFPVISVIMEKNLPPMHKPEDIQKHHIKVVKKKKIPLK